MVWSDAVLDEARRNLRSARRPMALAAFEQNIGLVRDAVVAAGCRSIETSLSSTDPKDRHVLAAASSGGATILLTDNVKDFDGAQALSLGIAIATPDVFALSIITRKPDALIRHVQRTPPARLARHLELLSRELPATMALAARLLDS